jgi:PAS domain S-box-containing protein
VHRSPSINVSSLLGGNPLLTRLILVCAVVGLAFLAAKVGQALPLHPGMLFPLWPANAILVSLLLLVPRRNWLTLLIAAFAVYVLFDLQAGVPARSIFLFILSDTVEVLIAVFGLSHAFDGVLKLNCVRNLAKFSIFAVILAPAAGSFVGALANTADYWTTWKISFLSEALEFLVLVPAMLGWFQEARTWAQKSRNYYFEAAALLTILALFGYLTFDTFRRGYSPVLLYSLVPFLLWAALRFGSTGVSTSMIVIGYLSIRGVVHDAGPFVRNDPGANLVSLRLFLFFSATLFMVLAALAAEQKEGERERKKSEEKFSKAFRESPMALTVTSLKDHRYLDVNETFERITGYSRDEVVGRTPFDLGIWVEPTERIDLENRLLKEGNLRNIEHQFRVRSGEIRVGFSSAELIEIDGEPCMLAVTDDITDRKRAEEHFRLAVESAPNGMAIVSHEGKIVRVNSQVEALFGYRREELIGQGIEILVPESLRASHTNFRNGYLSHPASRPMGAGRDLLARRKDGTLFPVEIGLTTMRTQQGTQILCSIVDITERKTAELALRESEKRFRLVANSAPVMIWMSGPDKLCTFFNQGWLDFTGRPQEDELGSGWTFGVHPEDMDRCLEVYSRSFDARVDFQMEYRLRRHDGQYRWVMDVGVPRFGDDGSFQGFIGSCTDITDRKLSEEALLDLSGRLITAHEEERARIARELHDDLSQRMALLQIGLEEFEQETRGLAPIARERLHKIAEIASEVSSDIHNLSHELHPSKLDSLGLVATVGGFCREFSKQHGLHVQFAHHQVEGLIPKDVTLCLFRIIQEALRNVVKHSGAREAKVELIGRGDRIELCISDSGTGFDPESSKVMPGLGLISMRERLRLVGGHLAVESEPARGTRILARVPLIAANKELPSQAKAQGAGA